MSSEQPNVPLGLCKCGCGQRTTISPQSHTAKGYVKGRPRDYISGHNGETRKRPLVERLWGKIEVLGPDECWPFTGYLNPAGYGQISVANGRCRLTHRLVAEQFYGSCPPGLESRHLCGSRNCHNPAHLRWGTKKENGEDRVRHGTSRARWEK